MGNEFGYNFAFKANSLAIIERIQKRDPRDIARDSGSVYDESTSEFTVNCFGNPVIVKYPECEIKNANEDRVIFSTLLQYLDMSDGTEPTGKIIPFGEIKDGIIRGGNLDRIAEATISKLFAKSSEDQVRKILDAFNPEYIKSNADFCAVFHMFPNFPLTLKLWLADDEFPASGRLFADETAEHYLTAEGAVVSGEGFLEMLKHESEM